jgi:colicin import membrane protein
MHAAADRNEFAPPQPPGTLRAFGLALLAHLLLMGALTWGVHWKRQTDNELAVEAELWSAVPQQAAPRLVEAPPPPPLPPPPEPVKAQPRPVAPEQPDAEIALARQKKEAERKAAEKREQDQKRLAREKLEREQKKANEEKRLKERQRAEEDKRKQAQKLEAQKREAREKEEARREAQAAKEAEAQRQANIKRNLAMAGATGGESATGNAQRSAGPSASYAGRIRARIKPNIVFTDDVAGNPTAEVDVRAAPDGTIVSRKLIKSSGSKAWDDAVLKAIDKTEVLPRDTDGRVPSNLVISFRPKD